MKVSGKNIRQKLLMAFNIWMKAPIEKVKGHFSSNGCEQLSTSQISVLTICKANPISSFTCWVVDVIKLFLEEI